MWSQGMVVQAGLQWCLVRLLQVVMGVRRGHTLPQMMMACLVCWPGLHPGSTLAAAAVLQLPAQSQSLLPEVVVRECGPQLPPLSHCQEQVVLLLMHQTVLPRLMRCQE
jgi:hypothetical protein